MYCVGSVPRSVANALKKGIELRGAGTPRSCKEGYLLAWSSHVAGGAGKGSTSQETEKLALNDHLGSIARVGRLFPVTEVTTRC